MTLAALAACAPGPAPRKETEVPDLAFYRPLFSPWLGYQDFKHAFLPVRHHTLVSPDRCYQLYSLLHQAVHVPGEVWECGVYRGGTAMMFAALLEKLMPSKTLHLFDSFAGMPETDEADWHQGGDFHDTSLEGVASKIPQKNVVFHAGFIPDTFAGMEDSRICFAHIDVDLYRAVKDSTEFLYPRVSAGGFIVYDDYGFVSCPGSRRAVDEFYADKPEVPLVLPTGQAIVFKMGEVHGRASNG
jgi:O-methyltransferase